MIRKQLLWSVGFAATPYLVVLGGQAPARPVAATPKSKIDVVSTLKAHCASCHSGSSPSGGLDLSTAEGLKKGGASGAAFIAKDSAKSILIQRLRGLGGKPQMPMGFSPLPKETIDGIAAWIDSGASFTPGASGHWAYLKPVRPPIPSVKNKAWVRNPIDAFVLARLEKEHLVPSKEADKGTLLRRVTLDLTGLPPTLAEEDDFLNDRSPDPYEKVVDRLLASPHYGERQARPWLDLARYADSNGYEVDDRRSMWPYRDWVINALNDNLPYDQFTIKQVAGDLVPRATSDDKIATGFNRNTMFNAEGGVDQDEQRWLRLVDRVAATSQTWLGSTLACAQCHDHKYDPFPQKDFYRFLAFFESANEPAFRVPTPQLEPQRFALRKEIADQEALLKGFKGDTTALANEQLKLQHLNDRAIYLQDPETLIMQERPGGVPQTNLRIKGSFLNKGEVVQATTPTALGPMPAGLPRNRLGLARWLASKENPLTARVEVNRTWELYFGRGIVETSEDFGTQGSRPSNQPLLDWLATEFMGRNWDMKAMSKLIVTSATYRQTSAASPALLAKDPPNVLLARGPRFRMEAEMIRDNALMAAGMLSLEVGGPSVFPTQPEGIWFSPYSSDNWHESAGDEKFRRGVYTFWKRTAPYPAFVTLDATSREACTVRRIRTNTPLQALTLLNDEAFMDAARGLAYRMTHEGGATPISRIEYGFRLCTARRPKPAEEQRLVALYQQMKHRYNGDPKAALKLAGDPEAAALTMVANVLLNLDETITKE